MKLLRRSLCLLLLVAMVISLAACAGESQTASNAPSSSEDEGNWRPNPEKVEEVEFVDTDGDFDYEEITWEGPEGYVIVVPAGDTEAKETAKILQDYYAATAEVTLKIVTDNTAEVDKEILIGKTNRAASDKEMKEADLEVKVDGKKLVFGGGHYVTTESAVNKFVRLAPAKGKAYTFKVTTDFVSTVLEDYYYVWGDEFEGTDIDFTKWDFEARMSGSTRNELSWEKDCIEVLDGRLTIRTRRHFNPERAGVEYRSPYSTLHKYHMNYIYGYAEIRARIPFEKGIWPSFWSLNGCDIAEKKYGIKYREGAKFGVEVDVYEVFGSDSVVVPNIHKWYNGTYNYWTENGLEQGTNNNHTQFIGEKISWNWKEKLGSVDTLDQQYHLYGFEWTPTKMSMYVDGTEYMVFDITKSYDLCEDMSQYHTPLYNMFNCHVFIDDPENTFVPNLITDNLEVLPTEYCIDWYRVYQRKDGKSKIYVDDEPRDYEYTGRYDD